MTKKKSGRGKRMSMFTALPPTLKHALRSQPRLERVVATAVQAQAQPAEQPLPTDRLLPTQPPSEAEYPDAASETSSMDMDSDSDKENVRPATAAASPPSPLPASASVLGSAVVSRRVETVPMEVNADHPWDCTGLVPRYTDASSLPKELRKYWWQRHSLFPAYSRLPLLLDETGWFSVTPAEIAAHIAERCRADVVLDAFCGLGGNAIAFARTCERVIAMDNDPTRLRLARHNALHHGVADRIEFVLADFVQWARAHACSGHKDREPVDVVFLSPPWGPSYLASGTYPLSAVEPIPGDELFALCTPISPNIAYFLPRNVDVDEVAALAEQLVEPQDDAPDGERKRDKEWVEVEEEWVGDKLKAVTAYYGALVSGA